MIYDKLTLIEIFSEFVELKEEVLALEAQVTSLTTELAEAEAALIQYQEYASLLEDPEVVAAYESAKNALNPIP